MPSCPKEETQEASSDPEEGTQDKAGSLTGWTDLGGPALPAHWKLTINGIFLKKMTSPTWSQRVQTGMEEAAPQRFLPTIEEVDEEVDEKSASVCDYFASECGYTRADSERCVTGTGNRQQAMDSPGMEECRKAQKKWKCNIARPNYRQNYELVVGSKIILYERKIKRDGEVEKYNFQLVA